MISEENSTDFPENRCGYVAIVGRPNVGKSTLLNHMLGQKLSITSRRPQTTRHQVLGIKTEGGVQTVYVDTPGMHKVQKKAINRYMNKAASSALAGINVIVFVVDRLTFNEEDQMVLEKVKGAHCPVILAVNKVDKIADKSLLIPHIEMLSTKMDFHAVVPISAQHGYNLDSLDKMINDLIQKHHVSIIIGGLFPDTAKEEYLEAKKYGVLYVSL
ncbi:MAG: GTPase Era, partial [Endozoicomonas sp.]